METNKKAQGFDSERGEFIRTRMIELGIRRVDLAERVGVREQTITNWQNGKPIAEKHIPRLAVSLRVPEARLDASLQVETPAEVWSSFEKSRAGKSALRHEKEWLRFICDHPPPGEVPMDAAFLEGLLVLLRGKLRSDMIASAARTTAELRAVTDAND